MDLPGFMDGGIDLVKRVRCVAVVLSTLSACEDLCCGCMISVFVWLLASHSGDQDLW